MSVNIKQLDGTLKKVAGNTVILDATASEIREGVITASQIGTVEGEGYKTLEIPLSPAMPDTKYFVVFNGSTNSNFQVVAQRPETGKFYCTFRNTVSTSVTADMDCHWYAVRLVELEGYTALQNKVNNSIDSSPTQNSTNFVTSGGVYDAIKNASSVFIGTSSEWESESAKTDYQVAILTDKPNVNAVDSTDGSTTVVANKHLVFKGTLEEWEALTTAEKKAYDEALITNDMDTGEVVNGVTDGDMRAVTSNAVYDAITDLTPVDTVTNGNMKAVTSNAVYDALFANDVEKTFFIPTPSSGQVYTGDCWYIRKGNVVTVSIGIAGLTAYEPGETVFTLPTGLRPCSNRVFGGCSNNYRLSNGNMQIKQNGDISVTGENGCFGTITYVTE